MSTLLPAVVASLGGLDAVVSHYSLSASYGYRSPELRSDPAAPSVLGSLSPGSYNLEVGAGNLDTLIHASLKPSPKAKAFDVPRAYLVQL